VQICPADSKSCEKDNDPDPDMPAKGAAKRVHEPFRDHQGHGPDEGAGNPCQPRSCRDAPRAAQQKDHGADGTEHVADEDHRPLNDIEGQYG
jgi:hypothetical protein